MALTSQPIQNDRRNEPTWALLRTLKRRKQFGSSFSSSGVDSQLDKLIWMWPWTVPGWLILPNGVACINICRSHIDWTNHNNLMLLKTKTLGWRWLRLTMGLYGWLWVYDGRLNHKETQVDMSCISHLHHNMSQTVLAWQSNLSECVCNPAGIRVIKDIFDVKDFNACAYSRWITLSYLQWYSGPIQC